VIADVRTILLAEDNVNDVELTLAALRENNLINPVVVARDGSEALDYLHQRNRYADRVTGNPGLFLLDLKMPKVDGIDVLRAVKSDERFKTIPVVVLTSSDEEEDRLAAYRQFVNSYVRKPVNYDQFVTAARALGLYWLVLNRPLPRSTA